MPKERERMNIQLKKKVTRYLEISEGFLEEEAMSDPSFEGQEGHCELTSCNTALVPEAYLLAVPILTHLILKTTHKANTIATPFYK